MKITNSLTPQGRLVLHTNRFRSGPKLLVFLGEACHGQVKKSEDADRDSPFPKEKFVLITKSLPTRSLDDLKTS